jgi:hypothetical protein
LTPGRRLGLYAFYERKNYMAGRFLFSNGPAKKLCELSVAQRGQWNRTSERGTFPLGLPKPAYPPGRMGDRTCRRPLTVRRGGEPEKDPLRFVSCRVVGI